MTVEFQVVEAMLDYDDLGITTFLRQKASLGRSEAVEGAVG